MPDILSRYQTLKKFNQKLLKEKEVTLSLAESCTGGKIAETITPIAGASSYFKGSIVNQNIVTLRNIFTN